MKKLLAFLFAGLTFTGVSFGCVPNVDCVFAPIVLGSSNVSETRFYTGLIWEIGGTSASKMPDFAFGVRRTTTENIDRVTGAEANIRIGFANGIVLDSGRMSYVGGKTSALALLGGGYSFKQNSAIATGAVQSEYLRVSTDYLISTSKFQYFVEANTLKNPEKTSVGGGSCPVGYSNYTIPASDITDTINFYVMNPSRFIDINGGTPSQLFVNNTGCLNNLFSPT